MLGGAQGHVVAIQEGYRLNTELGYIDIRDYKPVPYVTYNITVQFVGLQINETNETYDEPYLIMSVITLAPDFLDGDQMVATQKIEVPGDDHPAGYVFADVNTIWKEGQLIGGTGIKVALFAFEEDSGDPDEVEAAIHDYLKKKAEQSAAAIGQAFNAGAGATSVLNSPEFEWFLKGASLGLAGWVADDEVGYASVEVALSEIKELVKLSKAGTFAESLTTGPDGMKYNYTRPVGGDGKYTIYFRVSANEIPSTDRIPLPGAP